MTKRHEWSCILCDTEKQLKLFIDEFREYYSDGCHCQCETCFLIYLKYELFEAMEEKQERFMAIDNLLTNLGTIGIAFLLHRFLDDDEHPFWDRERIE